MILTDTEINSYTDNKTIKVSAETDAAILRLILWLPKLIVSCIVLLILIV